MKDDLNTQLRDSIASKKDNFAKSLTNHFLKKGGHKYIRRTGEPGNYQYEYEDDLVGGRSKKEKAELPLELKGVLKTISSHLKDQKSEEEKIEYLKNIGITDSEAIVKILGSDLSKVLAEVENPLNTPTISPKIQNGISKELENNLGEKIDVNTRWDTYELFMDMVIKGVRKGLIAYGTGGVGKTFVSSKVLKSSIDPLTGNNLIEFDEELDPEAADYDFVRISGRTTAAALYKSLYEFNKKIIIFDDCDDVLKDPTAINLLKAAIDTSGDGTITYATSSPQKDAFGQPIPVRFKFRGQVCFISNIKSERMKQDPHLAALLSRTLSVDLTMTAAETIERLKAIKDKIPFESSKGEPIEVSTRERNLALEFLDKYKDKIALSKVNARTLGSIALIIQNIEKNPAQYKNLDWKKVALSLFG